MEYSVVEVPVGDYLPDGRFVGEEIEVNGREVSVHHGWDTDPEDLGDVYGVILRLYECPDGYRVHELMWSVVPGRSAVASLFPVGEDGNHVTYTKQEVRQGWGKYFEKYFDSW
jgi:hypothetical protein